MLTLNTNYSPYFTRLGRDRTKIPIAVNLVLGTDSFECSGIILARHSDVLLEMILQSKEIYLDDFTGEREVLEDCIDLLHGGEVEVGMGNIRGLLKFGLNYKVGDLVETCLGWVKSNIKKENLAALLKVGFFVNDLENDDAVPDVDKSHPTPSVLDSCQGCISLLLDGPISANELSKSVGLTNNLESDTETINFFVLNDNFFTKLHKTSIIEVLTDWIDSEEKASFILAGFKGKRDPLSFASDTTVMSFIENAILYIQDDESLKTLNQLQYGFMKKRLQVSDRKAGGVFQSMKRVLENRDAAQLSFRDQLEPPLREEYMYAEIVVEWIRCHGTGPGKLKPPVVKHLWSTINQKDLCYEYLVILHNTVISLGYQVENVTDLGHANYRHTGLSLLEPTPEEPLKGLSTTCQASMGWYCRVKGCQFNSETVYNHERCLELSTTFPVYKLALENKNYTDLALKLKHTHDDLVKHWYLSFEKDGQRVLLSLVTNDFVKVMTQIRNVRENQLLNMHCLELGQR